MAWILLSLLYAVTNAVYVSFNSKHHFNGYVLGIWRGFGIAFVVSPLLFTVPLDIAADYFLILVMQGIMIGIYDSHLFFATFRYGAHASSGFMATTVWVTALLWWSIDFAELKQLLAEPVKLMSLGFILCGFSLSYWQMMKVHISLAAEKYLYPAVFALALMSIATRYIALNGGSAYAGVVYYLTVACLVSGVYNLVGFWLDKGNEEGMLSPPPDLPPQGGGKNKEWAPQGGGKNKEWALQGGERMEGLLQRKKGDKDVMLSPSPSPSCSVRLANACQLPGYSSRCCHPHPSSPLKGEGRRECELLNGEGRRECELLNGEGRRESESAKGEGSLIKGEEKERGGYQRKKVLLLAPLKHWNGAWLVLFSTVLIGAKTLALRFADNPAYVVAMLLLSPMFAEVIQTHRLKFTPYSVLVVLFLLALLVLVTA